MKRREFIALIGGAAAAWPLAGRAQQTANPVFGMLLFFSREEGKTFTEPIRAYMRALGYVEGRNITFDFRFADKKVDRLSALAVELVGRRPNVIATFGDAAGIAAQAATNQIPIVSMSEDLVRAKLVSNLHHPGGNITGVSIMGTELDAKRLEILAEVLPPHSNILLLADVMTHRESRPAIDAVAQSLALTLEEVNVRSEDEIGRALHDAKQRGMAGVNVLSSAFLFAHRMRIVTLAQKYGLATIFQWPETADEGGLLAYGPSLLGAFRRVAVTVAKVLHGANPHEIPVEQPTRFALHVNLNTAKSLGISMPESILISADKAIG